jgi:hypothetical protein
MIELTTAFTQNGSGIGYPTINDTAVKASIQTIDLDSKAITLQVRAGTFVGSVFTPDPHTGIVATLFVNYGVSPYTCQVTNVTGLNETFNLTLSSQTTPINDMVANAQATQTQIEGFLAVVGGLFPGTQVTG